ncbi:hypothetical protein DLM76_01565 [Leptospira yasudae]|nr:hypothetical protein DLM76_01565 [Leptospira yasudae]
MESISLQSSLPGIPGFFSPLEFTSNKNPYFAEEDISSFDLIDHPQRITECKFRRPILYGTGTGFIPVIPINFQHGRTSKGKT